MKKYNLMLLSKEERKLATILTIDIWCLMIVAPAMAGAAVYIAFGYLGPAAMTCLINFRFNIKQIGKDSVRINTLLEKCRIK